MASEARKPYADHVENPTPISLRVEGELLKLQFIVPNGNTRNLMLTETYYFKFLY